MRTPAEAPRRLLFFRLDPFSRSSPGGLCRRLHPPPSARFASLWRLRVDFLSARTLQPIAGHQVQRFEPFTRRSAGLWLRPRLCRPSCECPANQMHDYATAWRNALSWNIQHLQSWTGTSQTPVAPASDLPTGDLKEKVLSGFVRRTEAHRPRPARPAAVV